MICCCPPLTTAAGVVAAVPPWIVQTIGWLFVNTCDVRSSNVCVSVRLSSLRAPLAVSSSVTLIGLPKSVVLGLVPRIVYARVPATSATEVVAWSQDQRRADATSAYASFTNCLSLLTACEDVRFPTCE